MSWNSIKNKSVPTSKRNLTALVQAANQVAAIPAHAPHMLQIGQQALALAALAILQLASAMYTYLQLMQELASKIQFNQSMKEQLRALLREFCKVLDAS